MAELFKVLSSKTPREEGILVQTNPIYTQEIEDLRKEKEIIDDGFALIQSQMDEIRAEQHSNSDLKKECEAKNKLVEQVQVEIQRLKGKQTELKSKFDSKTAETEQLNKEISEVESKIDSLKAELSNQQVTKRQFEQMNEAQNGLVNQKMALEKDLSSTLDARKESQAKFKQVQREIEKLSSDTNSISFLLNSVSGD